MEYHNVRCERSVSDSVRPSVRTSTCARPSPTCPCASPSGTRACRKPTAQKAFRASRAHRPHQDEPNSTFREKRQRGGGKLQSAHSTERGERFLAHSSAMCAGGTISSRPEEMNIVGVTTCDGCIDWDSFIPGLNILGCQRRTGGKRKARRVCACCAV